MNLTQKEMKVSYDTRIESVPLQASSWTVMVVNDEGMIVETDYRGLLVEVRMAEITTGGARYHCLFPKRDVDSESNWGLSECREVAMSFVTTASRVNHAFV
jgi:hypothetical protein